MSRGRKRRHFCSASVLFFFFSFFLIIVDIVESQESVKKSCVICQHIWAFQCRRDKETQRDDNPHQSAAAEHLNTSHMSQWLAVNLLEEWVEERVQSLPERRPD